jgi:hypothetical protein
MFKYETEVWLQRVNFTTLSELFYYPGLKFYLIMLISIEASSTVLKVSAKWLAHLAPYLGSPRVKSLPETQLF